MRHFPLMTKRIESLATRFGQLFGVVVNCRRAIDESTFARPPSRPAHKISRTIEPLVATNYVWQLRPRLVS